MDHLLDEESVSSSHSLAADDTQKITEQLEGSVAASKPDNVAERALQDESVAEGLLDTANQPCAPNEANEQEVDVARNESKEQGADVTPNAPEQLTMEKVEVDNLQSEIASVEDPSLKTTADAAATISVAVDEVDAKISSTPCHTDTTSASWYCDHGHYLWTPHSSN
jgi:hypothetical protein